MRAAPFVAAALLALSAAPILAKTPAPADRAKQFASLPYWGGFWLTENDETTIGGLSEAALAARDKGENPTAQIMKLIGINAPWNAEGKARQAARAKASGGRKADGWGYPMMMNGAAPLQFLVTPEEVLIINAYRDVRHIYTDGREHPPEDDLWPTVWGDSIGHWEGDTLVVDTISVKNPNDYFHGAPPLSEQAHYVERIRMVSPDRIEAEMTITDPVTLTGPWTSRLVFTRAEGFDRMIHMDYDNDRTGFDGQFNTIEQAKDEK
ncbi:MAG: hypothetical protein BGP16_06910 [Sphingobium sp. 66-54]|nr:MAG: hypothetical protein BGP16_06910 [Sphingobium sp. 66-54]